MQGIAAATLSVMAVRKHCAKRATTLNVRPHRSFSPSALSAQTYNFAIAEQSADIY